MSRTEPKPEDRLSIRTNSKQKAILRRAADARHLNVSQFVLQSSLDEAARVLAAESSVMLTAEDFDWLVEAMDKPARDLPRLRSALSREAAWEVSP